MRQPKTPDTFLTMHSETNIAILGSTGSIGQNTLSVVNELDGYNIFGITGHSRTELLLKQARDYKPRFAVFSDTNVSDEVDTSQIPNTDFWYGHESISELAGHESTDIVVAAIMGRAGLESTWHAIEKGKRIALANKETLVVAGQQIKQLASDSGAELLPVDSEHSAIYQCLQSGKSQEVTQIVLTASGGPFRQMTFEQMKCVTVEQALAHPTWNMGQKITIDSATMMNKALEIIEARWLFDVPSEKISVMIHPQSIIHSMVEFCDGSVISQMSPPDMKLPIQYALTYPDRLDGPSPKLDLTQSYDLQLIPPDLEQFPALDLGFEVARKGGTTGAVLNAANEAAVDAFLNRQISFTDIVAACREILDNHHFEPNPTLTTLMNQDRWAREEINKWIAC